MPPSAWKKSEASGRVGERVAERLWLGALDALVAGLLLEEFLRREKIDDLLLRETIDGVGRVRGKRDHHVQVDAGDDGGMPRAEVGADHRAPVATLGTEACIAEPAHERRPNTRDALGVHSG